MALLRESILLAFVFLTCSVASLPPTATSNTTDYLALMLFKSLVKGDPMRALESWGNRSIPMCQWHGVACGSRGHRRGHVVALDLTGLNLLGTISPALANITYLRQLNLPQNRFYGILPPELGNIHDLETLDLSYNSIEGQIPPSLSNCSRFVEILLDSNKLQGGIPSEFSSLPNPQLLSLRNNRLTGRLHSTIGRLVNLKSLLLTFNNITGEIPTEIGSLENLSTLDLGSNQLFGTIPPSLGNLSHLTALSFSHNNLEQSIPPLQEYGLGNEVSTQGDVYSYGILLLEVFTGKRPTDNEFGEGLGLCKYVETALPDRVTSVVDRHLVQEAEDGEGIADMKISCIISILRIGVQCSEEAPADRMQISDALKELQGIRDKLENIYALKERNSTDIF
ncbi:hypothetical protein BDA96_04G099100 [Sorghum bicolor]|uniref:Leucine-rich repeat-containing N-terminal plant-type domain-containing protein n=1 Tax=Sorghum bicolor TaxID=4558 RepID=A0A921R455_SORBI|nr:hypothetical protein BDA96_04G099100 [Sorghum bicolor]